jgi:thiol-disulfide isomerase/thioredoxin
MAKLIEVIQNYLRPYYYYILALIILILCALVANYGYKHFYKKNQSQSKFSDVANADRRDKVANVLFFHVDWCPHCKTALPEWNAFVNQYNGEQINGFKVECVDIDCTKETPDVTAAMNKYNIESFPTVKMLKDEKIIDFDSKITTSTLQQFCTTMLSD